MGLNRGGDLGGPCIALKVTLASQGLMFSTLPVGNSFLTTCNINTDDILDIPDYLLNSEHRIYDVYRRKVKIMMSYCNIGRPLISMVDIYLLLFS